MHPNTVKARDWLRSKTKGTVIDEPGTEKEPPGRRPGTEAGESPAEKDQAGEKPGRPRTKKQKTLLLGLYIALTVVAAIIVAGAIVFGLMSAPPRWPSPLPPPAHHHHQRAGEVEVEIPGLSAGRKEQFTPSGGGRQRRQHRYDAVGGLRCAQPEAQRHEPSP